MPVIVCASRVEGENGQLVGLVGASVSLDYLTRGIKDLNLGGKGYAFWLEETD